MYSKVLVSFLLLAAVLGISASVLPAPFDNQEEDLAWENGDEGLSDDTEDLARRAVTVDYRKSPCMPPMKKAPTIFDVQSNCRYTPHFVTPLVMAEYLDCKSSRRQVLRDFSSDELSYCVLPYKPCFEIYTAFYDQKYALDYILYTGVTLNNDYKASLVEAEANDEGDRCLRFVTPQAYNFTHGYRTLPQLNETYLQRVVKSKGPVLATMYFDGQKIDGVSSTNMQDPTSLSGYTSGLFDHDTFCIPSVRDPLYADGDKLMPSLLYSQGYQVPVMIVGFTKQNDVPVWIVRSDWFGENWGMKGYFYLKRGVNACNIALSPIRVLG